MFISLSLKYLGQSKNGAFVKQKAAPILIMEVYNKLLEE
jgi:hypothetical protein